MAKRNSRTPSKQPRAASGSNHCTPTPSPIMRQAATAYRNSEWVEAERLCQVALNARADDVSALNLLGAIAIRTRRAEEAVKIFSKAVTIDPTSADSHNNLGSAFRYCNNLEEALKSHDRAIALAPEYSEAHYNRGLVLAGLYRNEDALESYERAIALRPTYASAYNNRGSILSVLKRYDDALTSFEQAIACQPDFTDAIYNRGIVLAEMNRHKDALSNFELAIAINPGFFKAYNNRGNTLKELQRLDEALSSYDQAIRLKSDYVDAYYNRGIALFALRRYEEALTNYDRAIALKPAFAEAHNNRGNALREAGRLDEALASFARALSITPDLEFVYGTWLHTKMRLCDWNNFNAQIADLIAGIEQSRKATPSFPVLALTDSLLLLRQAAEIWISEAKSDCRLPPIEKRSRRDRIRVGYYSADYHNHATAYLMAEFFERHDRKNFDLVAFSFGPDAKDAMRERLAAAFDRFVDVRTNSDQEVAQMSRDQEIDIAVDLKGFTTDSRPGIFSCRAAPIQVNYLGYPGTMGAEYMDYIIADQTLIPLESRKYYAEKVVYLPNSYQVNDRQRLIEDKVHSREELGLPPTGFVFCCFNNNYKIVPGMFDGWMRILKHVDDSVLWLLEDNATAADNLRREAGARGVSANRLVFARRMPLAEHLARHRAADLFIDTFPCNAHTTASDALWAGLPVLTRIGNSFAARVAASLLNAVGLSELIATTQEQYEAMAIELATNQGRLGELREKLIRNRLTTPLFDTELITRHIENAYMQMVERYQSSLPPAHIYVAQ